MATASLVAHLLICIIPFCIVGANDLAKKLYEDLMYKKGYNKYVRPVFNESDVIDVEILLKMAQIIDVDERNQIMTTNVWVVQIWNDMTLTWNPADYDNVTLIYVPASEIWHPDLVLYNNGDGKYEMTKGTKATVYYNGKVKWEPPASFKSSCDINVKYFPFDEQYCKLKFGSWTYDKTEVEIRHQWQNASNTASHHSVIDFGMDLKNFFKSVEWDVMAVPAEKVYRKYAGNLVESPLWVFGIKLKRRFLFYTINLIIPLVSHVFITILVFYLPADSKEKISLCINILLSLIVFFLMLEEIIPSSSMVVPLLGKYLVFTMMVVTFSIIITVVTYNVHFRSSATHTMPDSVRKIFLYWLPRVLRMRRPKIENSHDVELKHIKLRLCGGCCHDDDKTTHINDYTTSHKAATSTRHHEAAAQNSNQQQHNNHRSTSHYQFSSKRTRTQSELSRLSRELDHDNLMLRRSQYSNEVQDAIKGALYIANHLKQDDEFNRTKEDWKYVALVIDRCFLWIYVAVCFLGTVGIICQAPMLYDPRQPLHIEQELIAFPGET